MPHFWLRDTQSADWTAVEASAPALTLDPDRGRVSALESAADRDTDHALVFRLGTTTGVRFLLLTPSRLAARINGEVLASGIRQLADRDAVQLGAAPPLFFVAETAPVVEPLPASDHPIICSRDRSEIAPGSPAVRCPGCGCWAHQSEELPCWIYSEICICGYPTALDAGPRWSPEAL